MSELIHYYRAPLQAYIQARGFGIHDAEDMFQSFLLQLLQRDDLSRLKPEKGRFRDFLLAALRHFLCNEWDRRKAAIRGGNNLHVPIHALNDDTERPREIPDAAANPERIFCKSWANHILSSVLDKLEMEHGESREFQLLKGAICADDTLLPYADLTVQLGKSEGAIKQSVFRLRSRYRLLLRAEIAQTVNGPKEVEEEIRFLLAAVAS